MQITASQRKATDEIVSLIAAELGENRAIHPATAITSCARLAGSMLLRSFDFPAKDLSPGNVVLSEKANEKGPDLINILGFVLSNLGINIDNEKAGSSSPAESNLGFIDTLKLLQNKAVNIMNQNQLTFEQMAHSCAIATAFLVKECAQDLPAEQGFYTAVYSFIEGSKTWPPALSDAPPKKKGFFSFWK